MSKWASKDPSFQAIINGKKTFYGNSQVGAEKLFHENVSPLMWKYSKKWSSTKGGNREMNQLYTTSQESNITRKTKD